MVQKTNGFEKFWKELKRRKVVHVMTVYAAVSFVILQLVDIVERPLLLPDWTTAFVIVLLCIGFVIAVFLSWVYDITSSGIKKTRPLRTTKHTDHLTAPTSNGWKIATYISAVIILALVAFNFISRRNLNTDITKLDKSIAVLPFINDSPVDSNKYFINGIMEEVLNNLQTIKEFRVLSRTSTDQYKGPDRPTLPEIAKRLNVNYIVEGSGQKYGNKFRLRAQLIKAIGKETHIWGRSYEQELKETTDLFTIQSQIAKTIAAELKTVISPEEKKLIEKVPTANLNALEFYQMGREEEKFPYYDLIISSTILAGVNPPTKQSVERAEKMYKVALKFDSTFAPAYTGLAEIYWSKNYVKEFLSENFLDSALFLANRALYFDDQLPDAYFIRGMYYSQKELTYKQALENFDKTLKLNPNYWLAYYAKADIDYDAVMAIKNYKEAASRHHGPGLSEIYNKISFKLSYTGFSEIAKNYSLKAVKLESDSAKYYFWLYMYEFEYEKCLEYYKKRYSTDSTNSDVLGFLSEYYERTNQFKEELKFRIKSFNELKTEGRSTINVMQRVGYAYWKNGFKDSADYYFNEQIKNCTDAIKLGRASYSSAAYYDLAGVYAFKGDKIKAYENLKIFNQKPYIWYLWIVRYIKYDPLFDNMRNEPEFQQIVREMEVKRQTAHDRAGKLLEEQGML